MSPNYLYVNPGPDPVFLMVKVKSIHMKLLEREFPGGPVVRTWRFYCGDPGSIPGWGTKMPQAAWCSLKKKRKKLLENKINIV